MTVIPLVSQNRINGSFIRHRISYSKPPLIDGLALYGHLSFCRRTEAGQKFSDGTARLSYQHGHAAVGLYRPKRNGAYTLLLKMITARLQERLYQMFGTEEYRQSVLLCFSGVQIGQWRFG